MQPPAVVRHPLIRFHVSYDTPFGAIGAAWFNGTGAKQVLSTHTSGPYGLLYGGGHLYWTAGPRSSPPTGRFPLHSCLLQRAAVLTTRGEVSLGPVETLVNNTDHLCWYYDLAWLDPVPPLH